MKSATSQAETTASYCDDDDDTRRGGWKVCVDRSYTVCHTVTVNSGLAGVNLSLEQPQPQAHELPWWILKIAHRSCILPVLSLRKTTILCIFGHFLLCHIKRKFARACILL